MHWAVFFQNHQELIESRRDDLSGLSQTEIAQFEDRHCNAMGIHLHSALHSR